MMMTDHCKSEIRAGTVGFLVLGTFGVIFQSNLLALSVGRS